MLKHTDTIYEQLVFEAALRKDMPTGRPATWSNEVLQKIVNHETIQSFLVSECFLTDGRAVTCGSTSNDDDIVHDFSLLGLHSTQSDIDLIAECFRSTKLYKWLVQQLGNSNSEIYYGTLAARLHDALLDDPKPYRSDAKKLLSNLYSWISLLGEERTNIAADRPNHSQRMRYVPHTQ